MLPAKIPVAPVDPDALDSRHPVGQEHIRTLETLPTPFTVRFFSHFHEADADSDCAERTRLVHVIGGSTRLFAVIRRGD